MLRTLFAGLTCCRMMQLSPRRGANLVRSEVLCRIVASPGEVLCARLQIKLAEAQEGVTTPQPERRTHVATKNKKEK